MKYEIGQTVYTSKNIKGWFDFSMKSEIPINTMAIVTAYDLRYSIPGYIVKFEKEFGEQLLEEDELKL